VAYEVRVDAIVVWGHLVVEEMVPLVPDHDVPETLQRVHLDVLMLVTYPLNLHLARRLHLSNSQLWLLMHGGRAALMFRVHLSQVLRVEVLAAIEAPAAPSPREDLHLHL
jgi:hypothetical protein